MPLYQLLTDRTLAEASAITPTTLIHIVTTADTRQNPAGSSYKAELGQLVGLFSAGTTSGEYLPLSGGTVSGATNFTNGLTANTFSASSIFVNGVQITGDTFVTGATYSAGTTTFTNNQGNQFNLTGLTEPFSGGSGNCIADLYVSNIHSCSPLNINPLDEGEVYFGSTSGVTIDVTNSRLGIGTTTPTELLHLKSAGAARIRIEADTDDTPEPDNAEILMSQDGGNTKANISLTPDTNNDLMIGVNAGAGTTPDIRFNTKSDGLTFTTSADTKVIIKNDGKVGIGINEPQYFLQVFSGSSQLYYDPTSFGGRLLLSGSTNLPRLDVGISPYLLKPNAGISVGLRAWNDTSYPGYGKVGDGHVYAGSATNGLNLISVQGTGTEDYIRFYAGQEALPANIPDIHIQGTGTTRGYVGIGTDTPSEKLDVSGKTKTTNFQMTSGATNGYVLTSDASGNASWQILTGGGGTFTGGTVSGSTNFTNGLTANTISATTYQNLPVSGLTAGTNIGLVNNNGNYTISVTGVTGGSFSGGTVSGSTNFTNGLTANTISATSITINGVSITGDTFVTGGTYTNGNINFNYNTGGGFVVTGITSSGTTFTGGTVTGDTTFTSGLTANTLNIGGTNVVLTNLQQTPIVVSGNTTAENDKVYHVIANATFTDPTPVEGRGFVVFVRNGTATVGGSNLTIGMLGIRLFHSGSWTTNRQDRVGLVPESRTINGYNLSTNRTLTPSDIGALPISGGTVTGSTSFTNGLTANTISATTYQNLPVSGLTAGTNIGLVNNNGNFTISVTGITGGSSINPFNNSGSGSTITWNVSGVSTNYEATLTATTTLNLTNVRNGDYGTIILTQDSVGGRTLTLGTVNGPAGTHRVVNGGGGVVILTSNANATDILTFTYNGSIMYWTVGNDYT